MNSITNQATSISSNIRTLADKAMLVRLARKRLRTSMRDKDIEDTVRQQSGDASLTVTKHLFRDRGNPVRDLMRKYDEVYRLHVEQTLPWVDAGPRLLKNSRYMDYMQLMRGAILSVESEVPALVAQWNQLVQLDINSRGARASVDDYPTKDQVGAMFSFELQCFPLPSSDDFRVVVDDETKQALDDALLEAQATARQEVVERMLKRMRKASEKLAVPIGEEGATFRDSLVENIRDEVKLARELNVDEGLDSQLAEIEQSVTDTFGTDDKAIEGLRRNQTQRDKAKAKLDDIMHRLGG